MPPDVAFVRKGACRAKIAVSFGLCHLGCVILIPAPTAQTYFMRGGALHSVASEELIHEGLQRLYDQALPGRFGRDHV